MGGDKLKRPDIQISRPVTPRDSTLAFKIDVPEPTVDRLPTLHAPSEDKMEKMRAKAASWKIVGGVGKGVLVKEVPQGSGNMLFAANGTGLVLTGDPKEGEPAEFRYQTMPKTMKGFWPLKLNLAQPGSEAQEMRLYYFNTRTKRVFFLLYDVPTEELYEYPQIMGLGIDFKNKDPITDDKGKKMFLSRISSKDLASLLSLAAMTAGKDTLQVRDDSENNDWRVLQKKLKDMKDVHPVGGFDVRSFIDGMMFGYPSRDEFGDHYSITSGESQEEFRLYVNPSFQAGPDGCAIVASFMYSKDNCLLLKEV